MSDDKHKIGMSSDGNSIVHEKHFHNSVRPSINQREVSRTRKHKTEIRA